MCCPFFVPFQEILLFYLIFSTYSVPHISLFCLPYGMFSFPSLCPAPNSLLFVIFPSCAYSVPHSSLFCLPYDSLSFGPAPNSLLLFIFPSCAQSPFKRSLHSCNQIATSIYHLKTLPQSASISYIPLKNPMCVTHIQHHARFTLYQRVAFMCIVLHVLHLLSALFCPISSFFVTLILCDQIHTITSTQKGHIRPYFLQYIIFATFPSWPNYWSIM